MDDALIVSIAALKFAPKDEAVRRMRQHAEDSHAAYKDFLGVEVAIDVVMAEGLPFLEIVRKAEDFVVDAIMMGQIGPPGHFEKLLFGPTVEKVLHGARRPVIVLPELESS